MIEPKHTPGPWERQEPEAADTVDALAEALRFIAEGLDAGRYDGLPEEHPKHDADTMFAVARAALTKAGLQ